jgi:CHAT domain-containing protein
MELPADLSSEPLDGRLIESLKKRIDFWIRSDATKALELADLAVSLSLGIKDDPVAPATALRSKATAVYSLGRYAESVELWQEAFTIYSCCGRRSDAAAVQRSIVDALMYLGRYEESLQIAAEARAALIACEDTSGLARLDTNVGNVYHRLDRNATALEYYERALAAFRSAGDSFGVALTSFNAANVYANLHRFATARAHYQLAEQLYREKGMTLAAAQAQYSLGYLYFLTGNYHQAIRTLHHVEPEFNRLGDTRGAALCLLDLAEIYLQMNVPVESAALARRAGDRFRALGMRYEEAKSLMFDARSQMNLNQFEEAYRLLRGAGKLFAAEGNDVQCGLIAAFRAELQLRCGSPEEALTTIAEARSVFERTDLGAKQCQARFIEARALRAAGQTDAALRLCMELLDMLKDLDALWLETDLREVIGDLMLDAGNRSEAYDFFLSAIELVELRRANIRVDEFRSAFMREKLRVYEKLIRLCLEQDTPEAAERAFYYLESRKARTLIDMLTNDLDLWREASSSQADLRDEWNRVREELHWLHSRVRDTAPNRDSRSRSAALELQTEIRTRENELARLIRRAQVEDPSFAALEGAGGLTADALRKFLKPGDTVIEYYADEGRLMAFVVDDQGIDVVRMAATLSDVHEAVLEMKFLMEKFQYGADYVKSHQADLLKCINDVLQRLNDLVFAPLTRRVAGRNLIIVPFDVLHNVPFHALYDGTAYLIEHCEIAYAPSARLYTMCRSRGVRSRTRMSVFGAPDEAAPHIRDEVESIQRHFPTARCFVGDAASRKSLAEVAAESDFVHIASHAVFRQDNPMFSAFKLSGEWLNAYDVSALRMDSALVTLSGCNTGAGRVYAGDEMLGLVRSFLKAGASALVVTLWPVNDRSSAELMGAFYEGLGRGASAQTSLRDAIMKAKSRYPNPYHWSPFILIGQD